MTVLLSSSIMPSASTGTAQQPVPSSTEGLQEDQLHVVMAAAGVLLLSHCAAHSYLLLVPVVQLRGRPVITSSGGSHSAWRDQEGRFQRRGGFPRRSRRRCSPRRSPPRTQLSANDASTACGVSSPETKHDIQHKCSSKAANQGPLISPFMTLTRCHCLGYC
jgi:hypothetical protein